MIACNGTIWLSVIIPCRNGERWLATALQSLVLGGLGLAVYAFGSWGAEGFGPLAYADTMRFVIPSSTAILLGFQIIYSAFFVSILEIRASRPAGGAAADCSAEAA